MVAQAESLGPTIKAVHEITTGYVEQHEEHRYGTSKPLMWWVLTSRSWVKAPINAYAFEHRDGLVLFDTGLDPALVSDPNYISSPIGRFILKKVFRFHVGPEDSLNRQPVEFVPTSDPLLAPFGVCYDCIGDGSMILLPTPGHMPGSMSLLVRSSGLPPLLFVGDLTYELEPLHNDQVPGIGDAKQLRASFAKVRELKKTLPDLVVLPSHDPSATATLAAALGQH